MTTSEPIDESGRDRADAGTPPDEVPPASPAYATPPPEGLPSADDE